MLAEQRVVPEVDDEDDDVEALDTPALLERAKGGDDEAFESLQAHLEPGIRRFVRRLVGYTDEEDDIVQDVFFALYRNLDRIDPVEKLQAYVFRIARNRCYDELRSQQRYEEVGLDDEPVALRVSFTGAADQPHPEDMTHWLLLHLEVREAMERLPETQREALILYSEFDMRYAEIAEATNVSVGTVKSRLHYAKKTLRQLLRPETLAALDAEFGQGGT